MTLSHQELFAELKSGIAKRTARVCIMGLGYVGLPLAMAVCRAGFSVLGFDIDSRKTDALNAGRSYIDAVPVSKLVEQEHAE